VPNLGDTAVTVENLGENVAAIIAGTGVLSAGALGFWLKFKKTSSDVAYINDRDSFYSTLKQEIDFLRKEVTKHQSDLINAKTEAAALKVSVTALMERVEELKADKASLKVELTEIEVKMDALVVENEALRVLVEKRGENIGVLPQRQDAKPWRP
jgi:chromosome segregation ATPase